VSVATFDRSSDEDVLHLQQHLAAQGVHTLVAQFTDLHGVAKGRLVPLEHLAPLLRTGADFR